ncbi:LacI family DNA-binding transcriptional regulator [Microbacterium sp. TNHR37B]|uniref:LacI family DNA-binding transcriptional regulator n=1 Tax=Microbacterium sp. TNHR37B TaxID=1775956 RepID=UPI0007B19E8F|nr:LacI family DNA-binding transcriptional regulator [Microbacterium sp. TNHR37B]KZE89400.1 HTH-type transcriptional repressor PurR [Microbacterium sp. TNHR37B]
MPPKPVRLSDVARAAGVSVPTASQVMNGTGRVAEETRRRVLRIARELDYRPNALARSVALGRSRTIGVLAENAAGAFCMPVLIGINRALSSRDLASILYDARHDPTLRHEHVRHMLDRQVDGIIVIGEGSDVVIAELGEEFHGPVVHAFGPADPPHAVSVRPDEAAGGELAARRLIELGRRRIAHVTADPALASVAARREGFERALADAGQRPALVLHGDFTRAWGQRAADELLAQGPDIDAVFAANDAIAIGLSAALTARGVRIPEDVAVIGYDNVAGYGDDIDPYLSSIDPRLERVGERAALVLMAALSDDSADSSPVSPVLVEGASTLGGGDATRHRLVDALLRSSTAPAVGAPSPPRR